jgi:uncharacterized membrane protein
MAGIGWRLEKMMDKDTLGATLGAFLTGVAVTSGPWLLTTIVLVLMRVTAVGAGDAVNSAERVITIVYAVVIVLSAPIDIVLSRYASDRVYDERRDQIATPLRTMVALCLIVFAGVGAGSMALARMPLHLAVPGVFLAAIVGAQWLLLSAAGGLSSPGIILRAFAFGAPISVIAAMTPLGYLYGYGLGQMVTLALLLWGTMRALPAEEDETASIVPALRDYWLLSAAAFAFHAGLWVDKLVVYLRAGGEVASAYAATAAVAWLSVVPACAFLFVRIETVFHRRFRAYYAALHAGARLVDLERLVDQLRVEVGRTLRGTAAVQLCVTLLCLPLAPHISAALHLGGGTTLAWLMVGAGLQVIAMSTTLLLYYFDFRREAFYAAVTQLVASGILTAVVGAPSPALGAGYTLACAVTCTVAVGLLFKRMEGLLERTFQSQPYVSEDHAA